MLVVIMTYVHQLSGKPIRGLPGGSAAKNPHAVQESEEARARSLGGEDGEIPWRRAWHPSPGVLPGEPPWTEEPVGYSPWGRKESDMAEGTQHACEPIL